MQKYKKNPTQYKKVIHNDLEMLSANARQTFLTNVKTADFNLMKDLSTPTMVGVGKEMVGI